MFKLRMLAIALLLACVARDAQAQGFTLTAPAQGSVFTIGQTVTVEWTGGDPSWTVEVQLLNLDDFTVNSGAGGLANTGSYDWTFVPHSPCGHTYAFYVQNSQRTEWTYGSSFTIACVIPVAIDIKPGSAVSAINPASKGTTPVAILSSATFDAPTMVDQSRLTFGRTGDEPSLAFCNGAGEDVNADGILDLVCHFTTRTTGFLPGDTAGVLKGKTVTGAAILGTDSIRVVKSS